VRALAVVRFGHHPPARHKQDRLQYTVPLASAQCNDVTLVNQDCCEHPQHKVKFTIFH